MATITIRTSELEQMIDQVAEVTVTAFNWSQHDYGQQNVEYNVSVTNDYQFESDDVVSVDDYQALQERYDDLLCEQDALQTEHTKLVAEMAALRVAAEEQHKYLQTLLTKEDNRPRWLFWKK